MVALLEQQVFGCIRLKLFKFIQLTLIKNFYKIVNREEYEGEK
jgi:hypothetical protein